LQGTKETEHYTVIYSGVDSRNRSTSGPTSWQIYDDDDH